MKMDMNNFTFLLILDTTDFVIGIITVVYKRTWKLSALTLTEGGLSKQYSAHRMEHMLVTLQVSVVRIGNYTGCPRRNVPEFGSMFLMLNYTDITQNTYIQSGTVTEIMAGEV